MGIRREEWSETLADLGVSAEAISRTSAGAEKSGLSLPQAIVRSPDVDPLVAAQALERVTGLPLWKELDFERLEPEHVSDFPLAISRDRGVLPLYLDNGDLLVGVYDLAGLSTLDDLGVLLNHPVRPILLPSDLLSEATNNVYDRAAKSASEILGDVDEDKHGGDDLELADAELIDDPNQAPIIRFVNALLSQAIKERCSDIHIEPFEKDLMVRFRIDGVLHTKHTPPYKLRNPIVSRIKIMAGLNIAEKRLPQDGRIKKRMGDREIDLRVSTVPVRHGERVVMRLLEKGKVFSLDGIGMMGQTLQTFRKLIKKPHGILLVSGPTGSGKSTTLYSAISEINRPDLNILTIEDPVEYEMRGIGQVQVNHKIQLTFAAALRAFLRQDPDVILVGEIRDAETAENAVQASLTGHMVFSTIHTNDSATAFARLSDMGVEPFLVASSLAGVLAQRLVRRLCMTCREAYEPTDVELADLGLTRAWCENHTVYRATGCEECQHVGYRGRVGIYELLPAWNEVKTLVQSNADAGAIKRKAVELGMATLRDDGFDKVLMGLTTLDEVLRVTQEDSAG